MSFCYGRRRRSHGVKRVHRSAFAFSLRRSQGTGHQAVSVYNVSVPDGVSLRNRLWRGVRIIHSRAGGLRVEHDGGANVLVDSLTLDPPLVPRATWRFGFGARTGPNVSNTRRGTTCTAEIFSVRSLAQSLSSLRSPSMASSMLARARLPTTRPARQFGAVNSGPVAGTTHLVMSGRNLHGGSISLPLQTDGGDPDATRVQDASLLGDDVLCNSARRHRRRSRQRDAQGLSQRPTVLPTSGLMFGARSSIITSLSPSPTRTWRHARHAQPVGCALALQSHVPICAGVIGAGRLLCPPPPVAERRLLLARSFDSSISSAQGHCAALFLKSRSNTASTPSSTRPMSACTLTLRPLPSQSSARAAARFMAARRSNCGVPTSGHTRQTARASLATRSFQP